MNHIQIYDNALPKESCRKIIDYFEFGDVVKNIGKTWNASTCESKVNKSFKDSTDLYLNMDNTHHKIEMDISSMIIPTLHECMEKYKKKFPFLDRLSYWKCLPYYNIQKFSEGQGYHQIHCEATSKNNADRIIVWMIYLNNAKCGTRFYYPRRDIRGREGRVVIWPAAWTHPHSGITPNRGDKYIATGWFAFQ